ncbi:peroxisomal membrane protein PMP34 [Orycteropus afer afer]|uniref:Peroxisomal membrane protein PMP34 n=1 Tax=Orycteropus afer afer TaxID=1230840 RepID=A0A8B6ZW70_ORYAF|nr:peroxisomal membrane protein PMP34 [Orycteropus afer afer]
MRGEDESNSLDEVSQQQDLIEKQHREDLKGRRNTSSQQRPSRMAGLEKTIPKSDEDAGHLTLICSGSVTAMTVFFPLDTARLRLQVDEKRKSKTTHAVLLEIIREEGLLAPYRGWFPVISSLCCSNFVYFYTFNSLKAVWVKGQRSTTGKDLVVGFVAGVVNVLLTTPLWVVNTRLKLQGAKFRNEDIVPTNYKGIIGDYGFYELVKGFKGWSGRRPFQECREFGRHRLNPENRTLGSLRNILYLLHQRVRRFGIMGLYKGLEAKLLQTVLTAALMFLVYEKLTAATFTVMGLKNAGKR